MAVVVFDSDVLIGFLNAADAHHQDARREMQTALTPGTRRLLSAVNLAEVLVGPVRAGRRDEVDQMLVRFGIETVAIDGDLARRAAAIRARTNLKLPDAFALGTCVHAEHRGWSDVRLASFDAKVLRAHSELHPGP